ncbi:MAG: hypothetical protein AAFU65_14485, partial [Pseudomonadota bacterium]
THRGTGDWRAARVHVFWGKKRALLGVIAALAERLDDFDSAGIPRRSWLRMRMLRVADDDLAGTAAHSTPPDVDAGDRMSPDNDLPDSASIVHDVTGDGPDGGDRLDTLAWRYYGDPALWRVLAWLNDVDDPNHLEPGQPLLVATESGSETAR